MITRFALGSLAVTTLLVACQKPAPKFTVQDAVTVRGLFDSAVTEIRGGRFDAWAAHFAQDARFHRSNAPVLVGRPAILAWGKSLPPAEVFTFDHVEIHGEGDLAYGWSGVVLKFRGLPADTAKQLVVFRRDSTRHWLVQAGSVTSDLPLPQSSSTGRR